MGTFVQSALTVWTPQEACLALGWAYVRARAKVPSPAALACLMGQCAAETLHWRECRNNCPGNVRTSPNGPGLYTLRPASERIKGRTVYYHPPTEYQCPERDRWLEAHPDSVPSIAGSCFRAFSSAQDGADDYVAFLSARGFLVAAETGDPVQFARSLKSGLYYTDTEEHYRSMLTSTTARYLRVAEETHTILSYGDGAPQLSNTDPDTEPQAPGWREPIEDAWLTLLRSVKLEIDWEEVDDERRRAVEQIG